MDDKNSLNEEMRGEFPFKVRNITITGKILKSLGNNILEVYTVWYSFSKTKIVTFHPS